VTPQKKQKARTEMSGRAFGGEKLDGQCADDHGTLSTAAV
jgi:hypothetical protein